MCSNIFILAYFILINVNIVIVVQYMLLILIWSMHIKDSAFMIETWSNSLELNFSDKRISLGAIDLCLATFFSLHVANTHSATCEGKGRD